jgi:hypothetical protein
MSLVADKQVRRLNEEMAKHGQVGRAAMKADMDRKTARKYLRLKQFPSEMHTERAWRTRPDPFAEDWPGIAERLAEAPELEAKSLFENMQRDRPGVYQDGQLRTFQRRIQVWQAQFGPDKEVFFPQDHVPGEAIQTDFTWATELGVTIQGELFAHMLCHVVLPFSNWGWVTVCQSESMLALRRGIPAALAQLGRIPLFSQTDNSTSATHKIAAGQEKEVEVTATGEEIEISQSTKGHKPRAFNDDYRDMMVGHYDIQVRTIGVGKSEQNGDVEASNNAVKRRLYQHLLLRGHKDFPSVEAWEAWAQDICRLANAKRKGVAEELAAMRPLRVDAFAEFDEWRLKVSDESTLLVKRNTYSVPSRLAGKYVRVRLYEMNMEVWFADKRLLVIPRILGEYKTHIDYHDVVKSMLKKPGAFARYRYREALFPGPAWHQALEVLQKGLGERKGEVAYLRNLNLAAEEMECDVEAAMVLLMEAGMVPEPERVKELMGLVRPIDIPDMEPLAVDLGAFDALLPELMAEAV